MLNNNKKRHRGHLNCHTRIYTLASATAAQGRSAGAVQAHVPPPEPASAASAAPFLQQAARGTETLERESAAGPEAPVTKLIIDSMKGVSWLKIFMC